MIRFMKDRNNDRHEQVARNYGSCIVIWVISHFLSVLSVRRGKESSIVASTRNRGIDHFQSANRHRPLHQPGQETDERPRTNRTVGDYHPLHQQ